ncbi:MAG: hypothetical protein MET45_13895 [Nostoc sp. LLA-1]|nr:hypothetical protein [Cyanocohniella sp. LLY]
MRQNDRSEAIAKTELVENFEILLPKTPITKVTNPEKIKKAQPDVQTEFPNGKSVEFDWQEVIDNSPPAIKEFFLKSAFNLITREKRLFIVGSVTQIGLDSLSLRSKNPGSFIPLSLGQFPATTDYKYGYYIFYSEERMSVFDPGEDGTLRATQLPSAFFEVARAMDAAEQNRNGANPGLAPRRNLATTVSFDTGTISVAATLPIIVSTETDGSIKIVAQDYLGSTYSGFDGGGGDLKADTIMEAFLEIASKLAAAEKLVVPTDSQPDNIQVSFDSESGTANISANIPFTSEAANDGDVVIIAIDYL